MSRDDDVSHEPKIGTEQTTVKLEIFGMGICYTCEEITLVMSWSL